jgi:hypothetical protein
MSKSNEMHEMWMSKNQKMAPFVSMFLWACAFSSLPSRAYLSRLSQSHGTNEFAITPQIAGLSSHDPASLLGLETRLWKSEPSLKARQFCGVRAKIANKTSVVELQLLKVQGFVRAVTYRNPWFLQDDCGCLSHWLVLYIWNRSCTWWRRGSSSLGNCIESS